VCFFEVSEVAANTGLSSEKCGAEGKWERRLGARRGRLTVNTRHSITVVTKNQEKSVNSQEKVTSKSAPLNSKGAAPGPSVTS